MGESHIPIPDSSVVALTALRHVDNQILSNSDVDRGLASYINSLEDAGLREVLTHATVEHRATFSDWPPSADHVTQFLKVTS